MSVELNGRKARLQAMNVRRILQPGYNEMLLMEWYTLSPCSVDDTSLVSTWKLDRSLSSSGPVRGIESSIDDDQLDELRASEASCSNL